MPPTANELKVARSWMGTTETDAVFSERYDRLGSLDLAIQESLRAQLASLTLDQPSSLTLDNLSISVGESIRAVQASLAAFISQGGTDLETEIGEGGPNITKLVRTAYR